MTTNLAKLSNQELLARCERLVCREHELTAELVAHLAEIDERKLYLDRAFNSLFVYCRDHLKMSEGMAYKRIQAARASRAFPAILSMLAAGELHLCGVSLLAPHLTPDNQQELLAAAKHQSKRSIERLLAARFPQPDVATTVRKLPEREKWAAGLAGAEPGPALLLCLRDERPAMPTNASLAAGSSPVTGSSPVADEAPEDDAARPTLESAAAGTRPAPTKPNTRIDPLSAARFKIQLTAGQGLHDKLRQAQDLLRHQIPDGDVPAILERALDLLLAQVQRQRFGRRKKNRRAAKGHGAKKRNSARAAPLGNNSGYVPAEIKRRVVERDGLQCSFVDDDGRRCCATAFLEFQHVHPVAKGGRSTVDNVEIFCHAHNQHAARRDFGAAQVEEQIQAARRRRKMRPDASTAVVEPTPGQVTDTS